MDLFTYGTLQFEDVWSRVAGAPLPTVGARVDGYAVYRVGGYEFPGMTAETGAVAVGTVYLGVEERALAALDAFEGEFYERVRVQAACADSIQRACDAYVIPPAKSPLLTAEPWAAERFLADGGLTRFLARYTGFRKRD
ncbi:MAG: gamma-glutamylcyclotransferase family protein [Planctomycetota bacterium]